MAKKFTFLKYQGTKGQLISKRNSQAEDSPKKRTNEFVFTSMRRVFVRFLGESLARKKSFRDYLTFKVPEYGTHKKTPHIWGFFTINVLILISTVTIDAWLFCHVPWVIGFEFGVKKIDFTQRY